MPNLSYKVIIDDVLEKNHLLQDIVSEYGNDVPEIVLKAISDLDWSARQFGKYWEVYGRLREEGAIV